MDMPPPEHEDHVDARFKRHNCYTAEQMQAYGQACRETALEEAAKRCEHSIDTEKMSGWEASRLLKAADHIRSLK